MAARTLSMAAYRALARRGTADAQNFDTPRPAGEVALIFVGYVMDMPAVQDLAERLVQHRPDLSVLICLPDEIFQNQTRDITSAQIYWTKAPGEHPRAVEAFLDHWRPDIALWVWGGLRPMLIDEMSRRDIRLHLVAAHQTGFDGRRERWLPELARSIMSQFATISARDDTSRTALERLGADRTRIEPAQDLQATGRLLPCEATDLDELSAHLSGRPIWLAADIREKEYPIILSAHLGALRVAHRILLILNPTSDYDISKLCADIDAEGLSYALWSAGDFPDETTQVLVADLPDELGLWYRMATVSFLGQSFKHGGHGRDPMEAAALGTAILYGPNVGAYLNSYTRLASVGAARIVNDATSLSNAVGRLIVPYQAAKMAHAGWDVVSEGAEVMDRIITLVHEDLDARLADRGRSP